MFGSLTLTVAVAERLPFSPELMEASQTTHPDPVCMALDAGSALLGALVLAILNFDLLGSQAEQACEKGRKRNHRQMLCPGAPSTEEVGSPNTIQIMYLAFCKLLRIQSLEVSTMERKLTFQAKPWMRFWRVKFHKQNTQNITPMTQTFVTVKLREFLEVPSGISGDTHTLLPDPHLSAVKQRNLRNHLINENLTQKVSCTLSLKHFPSHPQGKTVHSKCGHCGHHTPWLPPEMNITLGMKIEQNEDRMGWDEMGERRQKRRNERSEKKRKEGCLQELYTVSTEDVAEL
ncbi:hypothetical protein MJG53_010307 [Ovis ammon polii x Ovis aries]|uniref:Uncharacterized protein n=1 Tax=Ovis ammon polii x Ovis aries TaxID=2918886 RepID=A0ACB9UU21_9CETA|nr:hypothetical protein MJG53_010307 [Ovis ammon polii x Ovis aries]